MMGILEVVGAAAVVVGMVLVGWRVFSGSEAGSAESTPSATTADAAPKDSAADPPPTSTPLPTATPTPTPETFATRLSALRLSEQLASELSSPLGGCLLSPTTETTPGAVGLECIRYDQGPVAKTQVVAASDGRVVHISTQPPVPLARQRHDRWTWADQPELGRHVVIDHGPIGGHTNVQTVYSGLESILPSLRLGQLVSEGQALGALGDQDLALPLGFEVWADSARSDGARVPVAAPSLETQSQIAERLRTWIGSPTTQGCSLILANPGQLPGAARNYRNGTHRGIDLGCTGGGHSALAVADGVVAYLVNDYHEASVQDRDSLLDLAAEASSTPHWTLAMLYGNVVIIDHGDVEGVGHVVSISAHLDWVDPEISLGGSVDKGQVLGEIGNRGTRAASAGVPSSEDPATHLHWELFIDGWYLAQDLPSAEIPGIISTSLCGPAGTPGC